MQRLEDGGLQYFLMDDAVPKKSLGQHWLHDDTALDAIIDSAGIKPGDAVLEIGPGTGTLTEKLLSRGASVTAVELDHSLASRLEKRFQQHLLSVYEGDILRFDFGQMPANYKVVANIPYYLTSNLIRVLSETPNQASKIVLLVQKEVAERVAAAPGGMSLLSVSAQFYWQVSLGLVVPAKLFTPSPKVDSRVIILERRDTVLFDDVEPKLFFQLVKAGFAARRKMLRSSLSAGLRLDKDETAKLLNRAGIDPNLRAQALSLADWRQVYKQYTGDV